MTQHDAVLVIDACGLNCPLPVLRLRKRLQAMAVGDAVELVATDRAALRDVPAFCHAQGHSIVAIGDEPDGTLRFRIHK